MGISTSWLDRIHYGTARMCRHISGVGFETKGLERRFFKSYKKRGKGKRIEIPRISGKNAQEVQSYVAAGRPVIITDVAKEWECLKKWTPNYFKQQFGDDDILISDNLSNSQTSDYFHVETAKLSEIIDCMERGDNSKYARFNNLLYLHPELIDDVDSDWLIGMKNSFSTSPLYQIFIGAKGTKTSLHAACSHNFFTQIYGVKRWRIIAASEDPALKPLVNGSPFFVSKFDPENPDFEEFPAAEYMDIYEADLHPGEILYNPSSYWHHVVNLDDSIGFGFRWSAMNAFRLNLTQALMVLTATNPSVLFVLKNKKDYSKIFEYISKKKREAIK